ncbi:MAG: hypothetical protein ACYTEL_01250 [Planctomycetota bacterium]|jgi:hypothetical protein
MNCVLSGVGQHTMQQTSAAVEMNATLLQGDMNEDCYINWDDFAICALSFSWSNIR